MDIAAAGPDEEWGREGISHAQAITFANHIDVNPGEREAIASTLYHFPAACMARGMFFDGLVNVIRKQIGPTGASDMMQRCGVKGRAIPFSFLPHRDFYKLYFTAAAELYPRESLAMGLQHIAETFYPVFRSSMVGRTMGALMGDNPSRILDRLVDAYNMSIQDNEHAVKPVGDREMRWECRVEPNPYYDHTFRGIVNGTIKSHSDVRPDVRVITHQRDGDQHGIWTFRITW